MASKYRNWTQIISDWQTSGLSKSDFCKQQGIPASLLYRQIARLRSAKIVQTTARAGEEARTAFVQVVAQETETAVNLRFLRISTASGCVVEVPL